MRKYRKGLTAKVRAAARELQEFTVDDLVDRLFIQTCAGAKRVQDAICELRKTGEVANVDRGRYRYAVKEPRGRSREVESRIYRAMHVKGSFAPREVAVLADADTSYVRAIVRRLVTAGDLEKTGTEATPKGWKENRFRVRHRDEFFLARLKGRRLKAEGKDSCLQAKRLQSERLKA